MAAVHALKQVGGVSTEITTGDTLTLDGVTANSATVSGLGTFTTAWAKNNANAAQNVVGSTTPTLLVSGADTTPSVFCVDAFGSQPIYAMRAASGTAASPVAMTSGATLGLFSAYGYNGSAYVTHSTIKFYTTEAWGSTNTGCQIDFFVCTTGTATSLLAMRLAQNGHLLLGGTTDDGTSVLQANGAFAASGYANLAGGIADGSTVFTTQTTGFTYTVPANCSRVVLTHTGTLATGTVKMPASPGNGLIVRIAANAAVTALTLSPNTGQTVNNAMTTLAAGAFAEYTYDLSNTTWYRTG